MQVTYEPGVDQVGWSEGGGRREEGGGRREEGGGNQKQL
jgi:hypothetical protein